MIVTDTPTSLHHPAVPAPWTTPGREGGCCAVSVSFPPAPPRPRPPVWPLTRSTPLTPKVNSGSKTVNSVGSINLELYP